MLIEVVDNATKQPYGPDDWRTEYIGKPGLGLIAASVSSHPGKSFVKFLKSEVKEGFAGYMTTSYGNKEITEDNRIIISTERSKYTFQVDETLLDENKKEDLFFNLMFYYE